MACTICEESIEDGAAITTTVCCDTPFHTDCFVENLMAQRFNNNVVCTCGTVLSHYLTYHAASDIQELPNTTEFRDAFNAVKQKNAAMKNARGKINKHIFLRRSHFKTMIQSHVAAIKAIKAQINAEIKASAPMKNYRSCAAKVRYAISKLSTDFTIPERSIKLAMLERGSWRLEPSNRLRRALNCRA
jgi:hypothetical protein